MPQGRPTNQVTIELFKVKGTSFNDAIFVAACWVDESKEESLVVTESSFMLCVADPINYYLFAICILQFKEPNHVESYSFARVFLDADDTDAVRVVRCICILIVSSINQYLEALTLEEFTFPLLKFPCFTER